MAAVGAICQHCTEVHVIFAWMTGITTQAYNLYTIGIKLNCTLKNVKKET